MYVPDVTDSGGPPAARWTMRMDNTGTSNATIYIGYALAQATTTPPTSSAVWSVKKLSYDGNGVVNLIQWATGGDSNIWDNRASLVYA